MYPIIRISRSEFVPVRTLNYHVRLWGPSTSSLPPLVLAHGWMDVAASYQFIVDAFSDAFASGRRIIAPDWRGFGQTMPSAPTDHYVYADYLADLDHLLDHYAQDTPVDLIGHSMGGNIAMLYAGVRPARIRHLVNMEGFGMALTQPVQAPARYTQWLDAIKQLERGELALQSYDSAASVARRLMKTNPRLPTDKAQWLARHWARPNDQGRWEILGDPAHKVPRPQLFRVDETLALYSAISAPTLTVEASENSLAQWGHKDGFTLEDFHQRLKSVPDCRTAVVQDAGHMLHHDQPQAVATLIESFLCGS